MLKSPLGASGKWHYRIHGKANNIILSHAVLDGALVILLGRGFVEKNQQQMLRAESDSTDLLKYYAYWITRWSC